MSIEELSLEELKRLHSKYFNLGYINGSIEDKFVLASLTAYVWKKLKKKDPTINCYKVLRKIIGEDFNDMTLKGIAVEIEGIAYMCDNPPNFNLTDKEVVQKIKALMDSWMPF